MSGQPTKRGNWGTWAVIDYANRRIFEEDEIPSCYLHYTSTSEEPSDPICQFVSLDINFSCNNPKSVHFKKACFNCDLKKNLVVKIKGHYYTTKQQLQEYFLNKLRVQTEKKLSSSNTTRVMQEQNHTKDGKITCAYRNQPLCRKATPSGSCFSNRNQCSRFRASNETNSLCVNNKGTLHDQCELSQHSKCDPQGLCDDYRRNPEFENQLKKSAAKYRCVFKSNKKCEFGLITCLNCDSCGRYRGQNESNSKCKYNFGVEHNKCALHHCYCMISEKCNEFVRKPVLVKTYDRSILFEEK